MMIRKGIFFLFIFSVSINVCGCSFITHYRELSVLAKVGKDREALDRQIKEQEKLSAALRNNILRGKIKRGVAKAYIIKSYGEPILIKNLGSNPGEQVFLYRKPLSYFSRERVYLYFDDNNKLTRWEVE